MKVFKTHCGNELISDYALNHKGNVLILTDNMNSMLNCIISILNKNKLTYTKLYNGVRYNTNEIHIAVYSSTTRGVYVDDIFFGCTDKRYSD